LSAVTDSRAIGGEGRRKELLWRTVFGSYLPETDEHEAEENPSLLFDKS